MPMIEWIANEIVSVLFKVQESMININKQRSRSLG